MQVGFASTVIYSSVAEFMAEMDRDAADYVEA
jgi:hypothetical protein